VTSPAYAAVRAIVRLTLPGVVARRRARVAAAAEARGQAFDRAFAATFGRRVVADGPFAGMRYVSEAAGSSLPPKLVGSYEIELAAFVELGIESGWRTVVNVGCAEGYYAVGLARRLGDCRVLAYDASADAQRLCRAMAELNGVADRVEVGGAVDADARARVVGEAGAGTVVLCDCEGAELALLREEDAPRFARAHLVVELHDFIVPGCGDEIARRFRATHYVTRVVARPRRGDETAALGRLPEAVRPDAADEQRPPAMEWALCVPRRPAAGARP
jgi:hypothetical protein